MQVPEGEFFWRKIEGIVKLKSGSALVPFWRDENEGIYAAVRRIMNNI